jgi:EAL domain-containing protein (putative c-di-GMP-specific phosphodiesterase class I)/ActR/RegA family two-component response regulator
MAVPIIAAPGKGEKRSQVVSIELCWNAGPAAAGNICTLRFKIAHEEQMAFTRTKLTEGIYLQPSNDGRVLLRINEVLYTADDNVPTSQIPAMAGEKKHDARTVAIKFLIHEYGPNRQRWPSLGRSFVEAASESNAQTGLTTPLETSLRDALARDEFVIFFQPKVNLLDGRVSGMEALLRWQPPGKEMVLPALFIPTLESTGLIVAVGDWVLRKVCAQIKAWASAGVDISPVSINISPRQLQQKRFAEVIKHILIESGVESKYIKFEISETTLMRNPEEVAAILLSLSQLGIVLSIDEFGRGYSSLGYLKRFPLSELKIDRSFIQDVEINAVSAAIVVAAIDLAHKFGLKVAAEGVETAVQLLFLRSHGCDEMQGYYFSKPLSISDCTTLLQSKQFMDLKAILPTDPTPVVLLVDDNQRDLGIMERILSQLNCKVVVASDARQAFSVLAKSRVVAIVSDQNMPNMTGVALMSSVRTLYPTVARVLMSGTGGTETLTDGVNIAGIHKYLDKNWAPDRIRAAMHDVLQGKPANS